MEQARTKRMRFTKSDPEFGSRGMLAGIHPPELPRSFGGAIRSGIALVFARFL